MEDELHAVIAVQIVKQNITLLKEVDQTWLFHQLYASEVLSLEQTKASDPLTTLCKVLEKDSDGSKFNKLINILRKDSAYEVKANILQTKYSKYAALNNFISVSVSQGTSPEIQ